MFTKSPSIIPWIGEVASPTHRGQEITYIISDRKKIIR